MVHQQPRRHDASIGNIGPPSPPTDADRAHVEPSTAGSPGWVGVAQRTVASYPCYQDAERALQQLAGAQFPVDRTAIAGRGLSMEEKVTGTVTAAYAAARAGLTGAIVGALVGWLLDLFDVVDPLIAALWLALNSAVLGAVTGVLVGLAAHLAARGRRSFSTTSAIRADRYDIMVDGEVADRAAHLLHSAPPAEGASPST